jgi:hypothetical protein
VCIDRNGDPCNQPGHHERNDGGSRIHQGRQFKSDYLLHRVPSCAATVFGKDRLKTRGRPDLTALHTEHVNNPASGTVEGCARETSLGSAASKLRCHEVVEVANRRYTARFFVLNVDLEPVFDRQNQFNNI